MRRNHPYEDPRGKHPGRASIKVASQRLRGSEIVIGELVGVIWTRSHPELQPRLFSQLRAQVLTPHSLFPGACPAVSPTPFPSCLFEEVGGDDAERWLQHSGHFLMELGVAAGWRQWGPTCMGPAEHVPTLCLHVHHSSPKLLHLLHSSPLTFPGTWWYKVGSSALEDVHLGKDGGTLGKLMDHFSLLR